MNIQLTWSNYVGTVYDTLQLVVEIWNRIYSLTFNYERLYGICMNNQMLPLKDCNVCMKCLQCYLLNSNMLNLC